MEPFRISVLMVNTTGLSQTKAPAPEWPQGIQTVLDSTKPLKFDRAGRLPLYLWQAIDPGQLTDKKAEKFDFALLILLDLIIVSGNNLIYQDGQLSNIRHLGQSLVLDYLPGVVIG